MATAVEIGRRKLGRVRRSGEHVLRRVSVADRPLPAFLIVGAQKAGTTSLHAYLCEHPRVVPPVTKEVHFFDHEFHRGLGWYRAHFKRASEPGLLGGEATPYYLFHPLVPVRTATALPDCKLIVVLRNPIDRAFSHHNHERALGFEQLDFEAAIAAEQGRLAGEEERILTDADYRSFAHQHFSYLSRGRYADQLERWFECFDRDQILVLCAEELFAEPGGAVRDAQEFLGLEPEMPGDLTAKNARAYAPIDAETRAALREEFDPHNGLLYELVGRDFGWD